MATITNTVRWADNTQELKNNLLQGIGTIDAMKQSVDRAAASLGGQGLFRAANNLTAAIDQMGGVTKLTSAEQDKANTTIDKAIEKYKLMGMTAPPMMLELSASLKEAGAAADGAHGKTKGFFDSMVAHVAEGVLIRDAVHEVLGVMKEMIMALPEMAMHGSHIEEVRAGFEHLAGSTAHANEILQNMRAGTQGMVSDFKLTEIATKMLSTGVELTGAQYKTLTEASVVLANRGFGTTEEALNKLSVALETGKIKGAAKMLGVIDAKGAELDYQTALGTGVDKLTAVGKAEATREALLERLGTLVKDAGEAQLSLAERIDVAKAAMTNFNDELSVAVATSPALNILVQTLTEAFAGALGSNQATAAETLGHLIDYLAITLTNVGIGAVQVGVVFNTVWSAVKTAVLAVETVIVGMMTGVGEALLAAEKIANTLHLVPDGEVAKIQETQTYLRGMTVDLAAQTKEAALGVVGQNEFGKTLDKVGGALYAAKDKMEAASAAGDRHGAIMDELGNKHEALTKHSEKLTAQQKEWQKVTGEIDSACANLTETVAGLDGEVVEGIKYYLEAGVSQGTLATYYGLTALQVKAVEQAVKDEKEHSKLLAEQHKQTAEAAQQHEKTWREEAERTAKSTGESIASTLAAYKSFYEKNEQAALHGKAAQVEAIEAVRRAELAKLGERTAQNATYWDKAKEQIDSYYDHQTQALNVNSATLVSKSKEALEEIADTEQNTYQIMIANSDDYTEKAIANQKRVADSAERNAAGIRSAFEQVGGALDDVSAILSHIPGKFAEITNMAVHTGQAVMKNLADGNIWGAIIAGVTGVISIFAKLWHDAEKEINPVRQQFVDLNGGLAALDLKAHNAGMNLWALLQAKNAEQYKKAIDDLNAAFKFQDDAMKLLDDTVQKYGFSIEELGPKWSQQKLNDKAGELLQDYTVLASAGIDHVKIIEKMGPALQTYVTQSLAAGTTIPESMRPVLQQMADLGQLTDENGNKMEDLGKLTFTETLDKKFSTLIDTINKLADAISRGVGTAVEHIATAATTAASTTHEATRGMVDDWEDVEGAINHANYGRSPGGLKEIPILMDQASKAFTSSKIVAFNAFDSIEGDVKKVKGAVDGWGKSLDEVKGKILSMPNEHQPIAPPEETKIPKPPIEEPPKVERGQFTGGVMSWTDKEVIYAALHAGESKDAEWQAATSEAKRRSLDLGGGIGRQFAAGTLGATGSFFGNFGTGTVATLHGEEAVVRRDQAGAFASAYGSADMRDLLTETRAGRAASERLMDYLTSGFTADLARAMRDERQKAA